jgi:hypothetical protein
MLNQNLTSSRRARNKSRNKERARPAARLPIDQRRCEGVEFRRDEIGEEINFKTEKMKVNYSVREIP